MLTYEVEANVGGKIAQVGSRLIDMTAKKMADIFFGNFSDLISNKNISRETVFKPTSENNEIIESNKTKNLPNKKIIIFISFAILLALAAYLTI